MPRRLPDNAKAFRPVAEGIRRAEQLSRSRTAPVDPALVRAVLNDGPVEPLPEPAPAAPPPHAGGPLPDFESKIVQMPAREESPLPDRPIQERRQERARPIGASLERATVQMRFKATESERVDMSQLITRHAQALGTPVNFSHVMRAWVNIIRHSEAEILRTLEKARLKRPANEDALALADFERALADVYLEALRKTPRMTSRTE